MNNLLSPKFQRLSMIVICGAFLLSLAAFAFVNPVSAAAACAFRHKVQAGETVSSIAALYDADWLDIVEANDLKDPYTLQIDQVLCIPEGTKPSEADTGTGEETKDAQKVEAIIGFSSIFVELNKLSKNTVYNVRLGNSNNSYLITLGRLKTDKNGNAEGWFRIPNRNFLSTQSSQVCAKNVWTDEIGCVLVQNPLWHFYTPGRMR